MDYKRVCILQKKRSSSTYHYESNNTYTMPSNKTVLHIGINVPQNLYSMRILSNKLNWSLYFRNNTKHEKCTLLHHHQFSLIKEVEHGKKIYFIIL